MIQGEALRACGYLPDGDAAYVHDNTDVWEALLSSAFMEAEENDPFGFNSGPLATVKVDGEQVLDHPRAREVIVGHLEAFPCVRDAEAITYVPDGMKKMAQIVASDLGKTIIHVERVPGGERNDFRFTTPDDEAKAEEVKLITILEDVVTTLGSVAALVKLLNMHGEHSLHMLAYLLRGEEDPAHTADLVRHYLYKRFVPLDKDDFRESLSFGERSLYVPKQKELIKG